MKVRKGDMTEEEGGGGERKCILLNLMGVYNLPSDKKITKF